MANNAYVCICLTDKIFGNAFFIVACENLNYGYGCNETCLCSFGTCNANATSANESCTCDLGYKPPFCFQQIDQCGMFRSIV